MKKLYEFKWDCGRMGDVDGLFIADEKEVEGIIGKYVCFGEILGKHSEIDGEIEGQDITVKSEDQGFVATLEKVIGSDTISGYNPLDYYDADNA